MFNPCAEIAKLGQDHGCWCHGSLHHQVISSHGINSLAPGRCGCNFRNIIFELISWIDTLSATSKIVVRWMPQNSSDDKSTLVQVMAWCGQATNHYLNQCWPRSMSSYGVARPQWVNNLTYLSYVCPCLSWEEFQLPVCDMPMSWMWRNDIICK